MPFLAATIRGFNVLTTLAIGFFTLDVFFIVNYLYTRLRILSTKYYMLSKLKKRWREWREKWTADHTVDVIVDITLLLIDVIASPVLIVVRLVRYIIGDWIADKLKWIIKAIVHWYQRRHPVVRKLLVIIFFIVLPFLLIILWAFTEFWSMYWEYNWGDK